MPIHDVDMDHAGAPSRSSLHLFGQVREIRREYRGCKFDQSRVQRIGSKAVEILARCGRGGRRHNRSSVRDGVVSVIAVGVEKLFLGNFNSEIRL